MGLTRQLFNFTALLNCLTITSCFNVNLFNITHSGDCKISCIKHIAKKYFPCGTIISFTTQNKDINELVRAITSEDCFSVLIKSHQKHNWFKRTDVYILNAEDLTEFQSIIFELRRDEFWNPKSKFVLSVQKIDSNEITDIFRICSRFKIYKIILLTPSDRKMYTYRAFNDGKCGDNVDAVSLGTCDAINDTGDIFFYKTPTTLDNCTFQVVASEDIPSFIFPSSNFTIHKEHVLGLEQYLWETIRVREGVTINYTFATEKYGVVLPNGTATGLLRYLQEGEADIAGGGFLLVKNRIEMFSFIGGYNLASFSVFVPNVGAPVWQDVYRDFGAITWLLILFTFCIVAIICFIINHYFSSITQDRHLLVLSLWGCLCNNSTSKMWNDKKINVIMVCWLWFSFFITSFYSTALYSLITRRVHVKRHMELENLEELPYRACITEGVRTYFLFTYNKSLPQGAEYPECQYDINSALKLIASRDDLYTIELTTTYLLQEFHYVDEQGMPKLDAIEFSNSGAQVLYVTRGFPFKARINEYLSRMYQNGLMWRQLQKILDQGKSAELRRLKRFKKIRLLDLRIHFGVLLVGSGISLVCLVCELNKTTKP